MVDADRELARVRTLARVMDHYLVDPLIGFVLPGVGDLIGSLIGFYIVFVAMKRRVSPVIIARMILNLGIDAVLGFLPIIGDAIDLGFKANDKNVKLLETRTVGRAKPSDWLVVVGALAGFVAVFGLAIWGVVALVRAL
jgi:uncharacterized protein DUF4112